MKKLIAILVLLLAVAAILVWLFTPARSQQKTKESLQTEVFSNFADNVTGAITPAILRTTIIDIINSYLDLNGIGSFACGVDRFVSSQTTSASTCTVPQSPGYLSYDTGYITTEVSGAQYSGYTKVVTDSFIAALTGSTKAFVCAGGNPVINLVNCGSSFSCSPVVTLGTVTVTQAAVIAQGTISTPTVSAGNYLAWKTSLAAGVCRGLDLSGRATIYQTN